MSRLVNAGFTRMIKNKVLLICLEILCFTNGILVIINHVMNLNTDTPDSFLFSGLILISVMSAVFVSSFLGAEHSSGTIRNKLIIGHGRLSIYCSSFLLCLTGVMMMFAIVWILTTILGNLLFGGFEHSSQEICQLLLRSFLVLTALTAFYTAIVLCIHSKSKSSVAAVISAFVMVLASVAVIQMLSEPEYYREDEIVLTDDVTYKPSETDPSLYINPYYIFGNERKIYQAVHDMLPVSQMLDEADAGTAKAVLIPITEIAVLLAAGLYIFGKRDLK